MNDPIPARLRPSARLRLRRNSRRRSRLPDGWSTVVVADCWDMWTLPVAMHTVRHRRTIRSPSHRNCELFARARHWLARQGERGQVEGALAEGRELGQGLADGCGVLEAVARAGRGDD